MSEYAIKINNLTKRYSGLWSQQPVDAVKNLNLEVHRGEIFGFLGPNGAGKTTTIKVLLGIIYPTSGEAYVLGRPAGDPQNHYKISYLPENPYFYDYMTGREILHFYARLFGIPEPERSKRVDALLDRVGLSRAANQPLRTYSKGMLQRIGLAQCLINDPELLILDEPTAGLDPIAHIDIRDLILELRAQGKTLFISSHQLSDVEIVCDRVAILNRGELVRMGKLEDLLSGGHVEMIAEKVPETVLEPIRQLGGRPSLHDGRLIVEQPDDGSIDRVIDLVRAHGGHIISVKPYRRTLEDLFVETIQGGRR
ncbi:MAG: ABC transporter ATP-binding protein [Fimbriimonadales bacterium]|jgi:ABC-2 type transport system ATP-binding protein|nr:ABC transporter ATP-binding protein [Fimbriimonadales bacterium]GBC90167.1 putative ABC transporter ATP-binding protein YxlF [bacterium HR14]GIV13616.1 MAG: ABC transporter ATP-binding protein [Fimbriimonadales bacterium]CUU01562.1 ABC-2 type transport system ATP-binding protein [Armatimonadetes bacterium GBS]CUU35505.1 ABC-2 type transport system ATP-binding protein [Armatimonadetes bacterium GXS]